VRQPSSVFREAETVALYEIRAMVLSVRAALLVVIYGIAAGAAAALYLWIDKTSGGKLTEIATKATDMSAAERQMVISQIEDKGISPAMLEAFLDGHIPLLAITILAFSTFVIPGLILLVGYGGIGDDVHTRFARYVLQRVRRGSYLAGKIVAHFVVAYAAVLVVHVLLLVYATTLDAFELETMLRALPAIWAGMALFTLGYVAYTAVFSALVRPPFAALALGGMALAILWVLSKFRPFEYVWMGARDIELWALSPVAVGIYVAHAIVFIAIAWLGLQRRDV
jgi:hypothetical protein